MSIIVSAEEKTETNFDRPQPIETKWDQIPEELKRLKTWVCWKYGYRNDKWTKVPVRPRGGNASATDPITWDTFDRAKEVAEASQGHLAGAGFVVHPQLNGIAGIDLDKCIVDGVIEPWATAIINRLNSYTEISPSGTGIRIIIRGKLPARRCRTGPIEMYDQGRFLTITGNHVAGTPATVENRADEIAALHLEIFPPEPEREAAETQEVVSHSDQRIVNEAKRVIGQKFIDLWEGEFEDHSAADQSLCNYLAFFAGPQPEVIDRIFRKSGLMRDKWERQDYRERTIANAMKCERFYRWPSDLPSLEDVESYLTGREDAASDEPITQPVPKVEKKGKKRRRKAIRDCDVNALPDPEPVIEGFIDVETITDLYGDSNVGKTFIALDIANSIARGRAFVDHFEVQKPMPVAYIYSESPRGLKKRVQAWKQARGEGDSENIVYLPYRYDFIIPEDIRELMTEAIAALGQPPQFLVVDTLSKNMSGDENGDGMKAMVNALTDLVTDCKMTILLNHHTGKDKLRGSRGGSTLRCGIDNEIFADEVDGKIVLKTTKAKDHAKPADIVLTREVITLPSGHTSLVVHYSHEELELPQAEQSTPAREVDTIRAILNALTDEPCEAKAIASEMGCTVNKIQPHLKTLREENKVIFTTYKNEKKVNAYRYQRLPGVAESY